MKSFKGNLKSFERRQFRQCFNTAKAVAIRLIEERRALLFLFLFLFVFVFVLKSTYICTYSLCLVTGFNQKYWSNPKASSNSINSVVFVSLLLISSLFLCSIFVCLLHPFIHCVLCLCHLFLSCL